RLLPEEPPENLGTNMRRHAEELRGVFDLRPLSYEHVPEVDDLAGREALREVPDLRDHHRVSRPAEFGDPPRGEVLAVSSALRHHRGDVRPEVDRHRPDFQL